MKGSSLTVGELSWGDGRSVERGLVYESAAGLIFALHEAPNRAVLLSLLGCYSMTLARLEVLAAFNADPFLVSFQADLRDVARWALEKAYV